MGRLQGNDAAFVAAALTQAEASVLGAAAVSGTSLRRLQAGKADVLVRAIYEQHLRYVLGFDAETGEGSVGQSIDVTGAAEPK